jgi:hypothetical protein
MTLNVWVRASATRRRFLEGVASAGLLAASGGAFAGGTNGAPIHIRREIYGWADDGPQIAALRRGIAAMQARPAADPTSWLFQANIHGTYDPLPAGGASADAGDRNMLRPERRISDRSSARTLCP